MSDKKRRNLLLLGMSALLALVPFLFWRATWFGRRLDNEEIDRYLAANKPRLVQHALAQIAERAIRGNMLPADAARWNPRIASLAQHSMPEIRSTAAWVMGQDNTSVDFHQALLCLLHDVEPLVRRNAALSLVRFADMSAREELLAMLRPYAVQSPRAGTLSLRLAEQDAVNPGTLLARLNVEGKQVIEIRSPLPGFVRKRLVAEGQSVGAGAQIIVLAPAPEQVWEALRALVLVGRPEDLPEVERFARLGRDEDGMTDKIRKQAELTAQSIRNRL